jgi:phosphosulfolactate phosphohydrolase-like enzyme
MFVSAFVTVVGSTSLRTYFDGTASVAQFRYSPDSISVDSAGKLVVADTGNGAIRLVGSSGTMILFASVIFQL